MPSAQAQRRKQRGIQKRCTKRRERHGVSALLQRCAREGLHILKEKEQEEDVETQKEVNQDG